MVNENITTKLMAKSLFIDINIFWLWMFVVRPLDYWTDSENSSSDRKLHYSRLTAVSEALYEYGYSCTIKPHIVNPLQNRPSDSPSRRTLSLDATFRPILNPLHSIKNSNGLPCPLSGRVRYITAVCDVG